MAPRRLGCFPETKRHGQLVEPLRDSVEGAWTGGHLSSPPLCDVLAIATRLSCSKSCVEDKKPNQSCSLRLGPISTPLGRDPFVLGLASSPSTRPATLRPATWNPRLAALQLARPPTRHPLLHDKTDRRMYRGGGDFLSGAASPRPFAQDQCCPLYRRSPR